MACVVGGIAYWLCDVAGLESYACQLIGGLAVFLTRILAVKYHICLPILKVVKSRKNKDGIIFPPLYPVLLEN